jgi:hypothetical protein
MGITMEVVQNMLSHANATNCAVSAFYLGGKHPPVVQIGFADDGDGIASSLSENPDHHWATYLHDASVTENVLRHALTTRSELTTASERPSGGLSRLIDDLLSECRSEIYVRSGAAFIVGSSDRAERWTKSYMDHGIGTQLRVAISVEKGG